MYNPRTNCYSARYDKFQYLIGSTSISLPCLKRNNWDSMETEAYPITQNGLDVEDVIIESKIYGKGRIK